MVDSSQAYDHHRENDLIRMAGEDKRTVPLITANGRYCGPSYKADGADMVHHPAHYNQGQMEAIDIIEAVGLGYHLSNALKYLIRSPYKGHEEEDLRKAIWYIERHITHAKR